APPKPKPNPKKKDKDKDKDKLQEIDKSKDKEKPKDKDSDKAKDKDKAVVKDSDKEKHKDEDKPVRPPSKSFISLAWKRPNHTVEIIPTRCLSTSTVPDLFVVQTRFPPDDRSVGYERGTSISK